MKIVHQVLSGEVAGGQLVALQLAVAALDAGHKPEIVSPTDGQDRYAPYSEATRTAPLLEPVLASCR